MGIIENDFKLKPVSADCIMFDLELLYTIKPRKGEPRNEFKNAGYGLTIASALQKIINYRINNNHKEEAITLQTYLKEYKQEVQKIKNLL